MYEGGREGGRAAKESGKTINKYLMGVLCLFLHLCWGV